MFTEFSFCINSSQLSAKRACLIRVKMSTSRETIHSGHFMVSNVHDKCYDEEEEIDVVSDGRSSEIEVTPDTKDEKPVTFYKFGPQTARSIDIDTSLLKLNRCIQTAYAQLTTPKWKFFKGLKLAWKERIRLNNVIWRAWHDQFVRNSPPKFCFFSVPEDDWHRGQEAGGLMEGIYWKRRMETVCAQYKRWRHHLATRQYKSDVNRRDRSSSVRHSNSDEEALLLPLPPLTPLTGLDDDDWSNWFTDTLFSSLSQPYLFPNPKEMAQAGNADFIQPGLVQLQPSLEEIMASLENDGPLAGCSDPNLNLGESSRTNDLTPDDANTSVESMRGNYTSKDYAAASLLVEYSNSLAGQGPSDRGKCVSALSSPIQQGYDYRASQIYGPVNSSAGGLCDPYVPQVATIETNSVQYTLAKTWVEAGTGCDRPTTATAGQYEYTTTPRSAYSQMPATVQLLKSEPYLPLSMAPLRTGSFEMAPLLPENSNQPASTKKGRQGSRRSTTKKSEKSESRSIEMDGLIPSAATVSSTNDPPPTSSQRRRGSAMAPRSMDLNETSSRRRASYSVSEMAQSALVPSFDYPSGELVMSKGDYTPTVMESSDQSGKYSSLQPLVLQPSPPQPLGVVRPIPISLSARCDSAFSTLNSPTGFSSPTGSSLSHSPMQQRTPTTPTVGSLSTSDAATATGQAQMAYPGSTSQTPTSSQTSVLLLQQFGGVQIPIMAALPYANPGTNINFPAVSPKQEPDKVPLSPYDPEAYTAVFGNEGSKISSGVQSQTSSKVKDSPVTQGHKKTAKRPADSTLDPSERKRMQHLHAEQSRRSALKGGFESLEDLLPELSSTNTKPTNALVLLKGAERIRELKDTLPNNQATISRLKVEIQQMNDKISNYQKQLTSTGRSMSKASMFQQSLENYFKQRTQLCWKFWLMRKVLEPLMDTYKTEVQGSSRDEILQSAVQWAKKRCTKEEMRPAVNHFLVQLGVETPLLKDPASFPDYVHEQMNSK